VFVWRHLGINEPNGCHFVSITTSHDRLKRSALRVIGTLVDYQLHFSIAFVDWARPFIGCRSAQAIQLDVAEVAFLEIVNDSGLANAAGGQHTELARTSKIAIAIDDLFALNTPLCHETSFRFVAQSIREFHLLCARKNGLPETTAQSIYCDHAPNSLLRKKGTIEDHITGTCVE
jgi:hypothetical protein